MAAVGDDVQSATIFSESKRPSLVSGLVFLCRRNRLTRSKPMLLIQSTEFVCRPSQGLLTCQGPPTAFPQMIEQQCHYNDCEASKKQNPSRIHFLHGHVLTPVFRNPPKETPTLPGKLILDGLPLQPFLPAHVSASPASPLSDAGNTKGS
jgi:hypothetical protein